MSATRHRRVVQQPPYFGVALLGEFASATEPARVAHSKIQPDECHKGVGVTELVAVERSNQCQ